MKAVSRQRNRLQFLRKNYIPIVLVICVLFVGVVVIARSLFAKPTYVYVKIKVGQGLWWAATAKPNIWMVNSMKKGDTKDDALGRTQAKLISIKKYPTIINSQYDVYVTAVIKAGFNKKTGEYSFNRSSLSVGSPIDLQFPKIYLTGTVIGISPNPIKDSYVEKKLYLVSQGGYLKDFPYRYDAIKIGDVYFDGEQKVFEVIDKQLEKNIWSIGNSLTGTIYEGAVDTTQNIVVIANVKLLKKEDGFYFGEENRVNINSYIPFTTSDYYFESFHIRKIE